MSRVQLALNVDDLDEAVTFYSKLFGAEPAKRKPGYANFAIAEPPLKLVLLENPGKGGTHQPPRRRGRLQRHRARRDRPADRRGPVHRRGDRHHLLLRHPGQGLGHRPGRGAWEVYTVLADSDTFGTSPQTLIDAGQAPEGGVCCGTAQGGAETEPVAASASCC